MYQIRKKFIAGACILTQVSSLIIVNWNCRQSPNACENFCYATFCRGVPNSYTRPPKEKRDEQAALQKQNRIDSGVAQHPCTDTRLNTYWCRSYGKCHDPPIINQQTDEWPAARMKEGGHGAWLRCMDRGDNSRGGQFGKNVFEPHMFSLTNLDYPENRFCGIIKPRDCDDASRDRQFQYDQARGIFVDWAGNPPPAPAQGNPCIQTRLQRLGPPGPPPVGRPPQEVKVNVCNDNGLTPEQQKIEDQVTDENEDPVEDSKLRIRRKRRSEVLPEREVEQRSWPEPAKYLTSRGTIIYVPRLSEDEEELQVRDKVYEHDGTKSYIVQRG